MSQDQFNFNKSQTRLHPEDRPIINGDVFEEDLPTQAMDAATTATTSSTFSKDQSTEPSLGTKIQDTMTKLGDKLTDAFTNIKAGFTTTETKEGDIPSKQSTP